MSEIYKLLARLTCAPDPGDIPLLTERLIAQLADQIRSTFELGAHERQQSLMMRWNDLASEFKAHITGSYPTIGLRSRDDDRRLNLGGTRKARKPSKVIEQPSVTGEVIDISDDEVPTKFATSSEKTNKAGANNSTDDPECRYHFQLEEVRNFNQALQMVGMPRQADPEVLRDMKMKSLSKVGEAFAQVHVCRWKTPPFSDQGNSPERLQQVSALPFLHCHHGVGETIPR